MRKYVPLMIGGVLGLVFICIAMALRNGTAEAHTVITNLTSSFMFVAGFLSIVGGVIFCVMSDDQAAW